MKDGIIRSESDLERYPSIAFSLSFLFTGLGQIYNGEFAKGLVLFLIRLLTVMVIPAAIKLKSVDPFIYLFAAAAAVNIIVWLFSALEARSDALYKYSVNLRPFNSIWFYAAYGVFSTALLAAALYILSFFVSVEKISKGSMNPSFIMDEYVLINKYQPEEADIGDVVYYRAGDGFRIRRVIAGGGETFAYDGKNYYVNDSALRLGVLESGKAARLGFDNSEDLFFEVNGGRRYPVKVNYEQRESSAQSGKIFIEPGKILVSGDNRTLSEPYEVIRVSSVIGIAEGIVFTSEIRRLLLKPHLPAEVPKEAVPENSVSIIPITTARGVTADSS